MSDKGVFTPNDQFYVRWHWSVIPGEVDVNTFRLAVRDHVNQAVSLSLRELQDLPRVDLAAVNQCFGNSRGFFQPRMPGAQWSNGAMGNALWSGVRLKDVLDKAGVKAGAVAVRFRGLDEPVVPDAPPFLKSLSLDHARDGEVMIAYGMNHGPLPLLNGFPLRLVVPRWYPTDWVKMLSDIEVPAEPDANSWTKTTYTIPDTPNANIAPGQTGVPPVPINRMNPRSFITNVTSGAQIPAGKATDLRGIAFGGDSGVKAVEISIDGGKSWGPAQLRKDEGPYSFRQWTTSFAPAAPGKVTLMVAAPIRRAKPSRRRRTGTPAASCATSSNAPTSPWPEETAMLRALLAGGLLAGAALHPAPGRAATPIALASVSVDLPAGDRMFPEGPGADAVNNNGLACHSAGMVLNQPALSEATWSAVVHKMIAVYKAPIAEKDVADIVGYLSRMKVPPDAGAGAAGVDAARLTPPPACPGAGS